MHAALAAVIFAAALVAIVIRPRGIGEHWSALAGALAMLLVGAVSPAGAAAAVASEWNLLLFFLGLMLTAAAADRARFFDWAAALAAGAARGSGRLLLLNVLVLGALITAFLSNDATALILTPVVYALTSRLRLRVTPYLFAVSFVANAASMTLPISNPINVLVGDRVRAPLLAYERHLLLASLAAVAVTAGVFFLVFWRTTAPRFHLDWRAAAATAAAGPGFRPVVAGLAALAVAYVVASALLLPLGLVAAVGGCALLLAGMGAGGGPPGAHLRAHVSPALFVYIAGLFVMVRGVSDAGITSALVGSALSQATDPASALAAGLLGSAALSNLVNNLPAILVFLSGAGSAPVPDALRTPFLLGALAGADLGPNLTPVGALSTMLWLVIVRRRGVDVSAWDFLRLGVMVAPATLLVAGVLAAVSFR